jgi:transposase
MQGYKASKIAEILKLTYHTVKKLIQQLKEAFLDYFRLEQLAYP